MAPPPSDVPLRTPYARLLTSSKHALSGPPSKCVQHECKTDALTDERSGDSALFSPTFLPFAVQITMLGNSSACKERNRMLHTCDDELLLTHLVDAVAFPIERARKGARLYTHDVLYTHSDPEWWWLTEEKPVQVTVQWPASWPFTSNCAYVQGAKKNDHVCILPPAAWSVIDARRADDDEHVAFSLFVRPVCIMLDVHPQAHSLKETVTVVNPDDFAILCDSIAVGDDDTIPKYLPFTNVRHKLSYLDRAPMLAHHMGMIVNELGECLVLGTRSAATFTARHIYTASTGVYDPPSKSATEETEHAPCEVIVSQLREKLQLGDKLVIDCCSGNTFVSWNTIFKLKQPTMAKAGIISVSVERGTVV